MTIPRIASYGMPPRHLWPSSRAAFRLHPSRAALLVHDLQQYFLDFYDRSREPIVTLEANVRCLLEAFRAAGSPVIYTGQPSVQQPEERGLLNQMWGPGIGAAPDRAEIEPSLAPASRERVLEKLRYSAFQRTPLEAVLREAGRTQLVVCGVYAHIGCLATAVEAFMLDLEVFFVGDAVADFSEQHHELALRHVSNCSGTLISSRDVVEGIRGAGAEAHAGVAARAATARLEGAFDGRARVSR